jgi:hypothetical protein
MFMILSNASKSTKLRRLPRMLKASLTIIRDLGTYLWSGQAAQDPADVRMARIRAGVEGALHLTEIETPPGALDPLLDYMAAKVAAEAPGTASTSSDAHTQTRNIHRPKPQLCLKRHIRLCPCES